ncbi:hypothetical protein Tco_0026009 [Tanacetum coccineum]
MVVPAIEEVAKPVAEAEEEQVIATVVDMEEDLAALFGDDDFEDDASDGFDMEEVWEVNEEWLMAPITPPPMLAVPPPSVYEVSDVEVAAGVTIGELGLRVYAVEGQVQVIVSQMAHAVDRWEQVGLADRCAAERHANPAAADYSLGDEQPGEFTDVVYFGIG